jgi:starch phosphorylase
MKFGFNGVALVGSNDGTNVDILEAVGKDNFFSFGPRVDDLTLHRTRDDDPKSVLAQLPLLSDAIRYIESGELLPSEPALFQPLFTSLWQTADRYRVVVDFQSYSESKERAVTRYRSTQDWTEMSIRITSRMGRFSSDYVASEYCRSIWKVESDV